MSKSIISSEAAPKAIGAYSQACAVDCRRLLFISGQIPLNPSTMDLVEGDITAQAKQVMENIGAIVREAGGDFSSIVKATILLADIIDFAAVNEVYATYFPENPPARAAFAVAALPKGARVEIEAIAAL